jgi:predicted transposase/invertase (TIGR01784 family)
MKNVSETSLQRLNPLNDYLFYKVFGEKGDEVQLLGFLNAVLGRTGDDRFTAVEILEDKTFTPEIIGDKSVTFDIRAVLQGSTRVNVEVQLRNRYNMDKRSLYYWSREYMKSIKSGDDYHDLPNVIAINIVDFNFPRSQNYHTCFHLREDREPDIVLTKSLEIHFINMVQYRKLKKEVVFSDSLCNDPLVRWLAWFNENSPPELVAEVTKMDSAIQMADERMVYLSGDEDAIRAYEVRFKAMCDQTSARNHAIRTGLERGMKRGMKRGMAEGMAEGMEKGMAEGMEKGMAEGMEKGMEEKALEIAQKMKAMGDSIERIQVITGLSPEIIEHL